MQRVSHQNIGVIIAYILPGFTVLWGIRPYSNVVHVWLGTATRHAPSVSGFLYVTVVSIGLGIFVNTVRRIVIDPIHHRTGITQSRWDYSILQDNITAIEFLIANQFRFYQFHANMFVAILFSYPAMAWAEGWSWLWFFVFLLTEITLWLGSRDNLATYFRRLDDILKMSKTLNLLD